MTGGNWRSGGMLACHLLIILLLTVDIKTANQIAETESCDQRQGMPENSCSKTKCPKVCSCSNLSADVLVINCSVRNLVSVPMDLPRNISSLNLSHNHIQELPVALDKLVFENVSYLELGDNRIRDIQPFIHRHTFNKLQYLDLSNNQISSAPENLNTVEVLKLSGNVIEAVNLQMYLLKYYKIRSLYLNQNLITRMDGQCEERQKSQERLPPLLEILALKSNQIKNMDKCALSVFSKLKHISLANNLIRIIPSGFFKENKVLEIIDLTGNKLRTLPREINTLQHLTHLYLSGNQFTEIPDSLPALEWLDLSYNAIKTVAEQQQYLLYPQEVLLLGGNPFVCDCSILWLKEFYDTREYLLKYITVDRDKFVPVCAAPSALKNEPWDVLGDEVFQCTEVEQRDLETTNQLVQDVLQQTGEEEEDPYPATVFKADKIGANFVNIHLCLLTNPNIDVAGSMVIQYHPFGKQASAKEWILPVSASHLRKHGEETFLEGDFRLKGLVANTPYIICVVDKTETQAAVTSNRNCIEIVTQQLEGEKPNDSFQFLVNIYNALGPIIGLVSSSVCLFLACRYLGLF